MRNAIMPDRSDRPFRNRMRMLGSRANGSGPGGQRFGSAPYSVTGRFTDVKSTFLDEQLSTVRVCNGPRELTTDPSDVVDITDDGVGIR